MNGWAFSSIFHTTFLPLYPRVTLSPRAALWYLTQQHSSSKSGFILQKNSSSLNSAPHTSCKVTVRLRKMVHTRRKSSCVTARGVPPTTQQPLALLLSEGRILQTWLGSTPVLDGGNSPGQDQWQDWVTFSTQTGPWTGPVTIPWVKGPGTSDRGQYVPPSHGQTHKTLPSPCLGCGR